MKIASTKTRFMSPVCKSFVALSSEDLSCTLFMLKRSCFVSIWCCQSSVKPDRIAADLDLKEIIGEEKKGGMNDREKRLSRND